MSELFGGALVKSISIENLIAQRDGVMAQIGLAMDHLRQASAIAVVSGISNPKLYRDFPFLLHGRNHYQTNHLLEPKALETIRKRVDANAWNHLMHESGLRSLMDAKAREEWAAKIEKLECPELTEDNVRATFSTLYESRGDLFERGVINCFKSLSWNYKTNRPFAFGKRLVMYVRSSVSGPGTSLGFPNSRACDSLDDLVRVLSVLDGKPEPDHRNGMYSLIGEAKSMATCDCENEYLQIRSFRNGNGHITFKRPDLVERMNKILAKHYPNQLPADRHETARGFEGVAVA